MITLSSKKRGHWCLCRQSNIKDCDSNQTWCPWLAMFWCWPVSSAPPSFHPWRRFPGTFEVWTPLGQSRISSPRTTWSGCWSCSVWTKLSGNFKQFSKGSNIFYITLLIKMNTKLGQKRLMPCLINGLIKKVSTLSRNLYVTFNVSLHVRPKKSEFQVGF